ATSTSWSHPTCPGELPERLTVTPCEVTATERVFAGACPERAILLAATRASSEVSAGPRSLLKTSAPMPTTASARTTNIAADIREPDRRRTDRTGRRTTPDTRPCCPPGRRRAPGGESVPRA